MAINHCTGKKGIFKGSGILVYVPEDMLSKIILVPFPNKESFFVERNLREKNGLFVVLLISKMTKYPHK